MKFFVRMLLVRLRARGRRLGSITDVAVTPLRVHLGDLDVMRHMNNGVYLTIQDLGRYDWMLRTGLWSMLRARGIGAVVVQQTITYRASLELGQRFDVETRFVGGDEKSVYMEQRLTVGGQIRSRSIVRARFVRHGRGLTIAQLRESAPELPEFPELLPEWVQPWAEATTLPNTRQDATSTWARAE